MLAHFLKLIYNEYIVQGVSNDTHTIAYTCRAYKIPINFLKFLLKTPK